MMQMGTLYEAHLVVRDVDSSAQFYDLYLALRRLWQRLMWDFTGPSRTIAGCLRCGN